MPSSARNRTLFRHDAGNRAVIRIESVKLPEAPDKLGAPAKSQRNAREHRKKPVVVPAAISKPKSLPVIRKTGHKHHCAS